MKRLFTFGDSFTQYCWPMWPDIIGQNFDLTFNYGRAGTGNYFIFYRAMQCIIEKSLNKDDVVIVQWTSPSRFDILSDEKHSVWEQIGDGSAQIFRDNKLEYLNSDKLCVLKQLTYMNALAKIFESIGCKWHYLFLNKFSMVHSDTHSAEFNIDWHRHITEQNYHLLCDNLNQYSHKFVAEPIDDFMRKKYKPQPWTMRSSYINRKGELVEFVDTHPTPIQTIEWIKEHAMPVIENLDLRPMADFSSHSQLDLISACVEDNGLYRYDPEKIEPLFSSFNSNNNYKSITRAYHV